MVRVDDRDHHDRADCREAREEGQGRRGACRGARALLAAHD
jgi:hypothetical protein